MRRIFAVALGILTAIGGFVDIGDLVTNAVVGSRFGLALAWVVVGRRGRHLRVSRRWPAGWPRSAAAPPSSSSGSAWARGSAAANLGASFFINLLTLTAEIGGVALALQLATDVGPLLWVPVAAFAVWIVIWRVRFSIMENVFGLLGPEPDRLRRRRVRCCSPDWSAARAPGGRTGDPRHRVRGHLLVLRDRAVRRGDDARTRCSSSPPARSRSTGRSRTWARPGQRARRVPARRAAVAGDRGRAPRWSCCPARSR